MEYNEPLINEVIINHIHSGMKTLYKKSAQLNRNDPIIVFQVALSKIKDISQSSLEEEYERLLERVIEHGNNEDFINRVFELVFRNVTKHAMETDKGFFIENIHELPKELLNMPSNNTKTLYLFLLESARGIYTKANLYSDKYSDYDKEKNAEQAKKIVASSITKAVKKRVNLDSIMDYYTKKSLKKDNEQHGGVQNADFHNYITRTITDVPDRLNWQTNEDKQDKQDEDTDDKDEDKEDKDEDKDEDKEDKEDTDDTEDKDDTDDTDDKEDTDDNEDTDTSETKKSLHLSDSKVIHYDPDESFATDEDTDDTIEDNNEYSGDDDEYSSSSDSELDKKDDGFYSKNEAKNMNVTLIENEVNIDHIISELKS